MTKTIPAQTIVTCDICLEAGNRKQEGKLIIKQHAIDYMGTPCANGDVEFDLCDECLNGVREAINAYAQTRKESSHE